MKQPPYTPAPPASRPGYSRPFAPGRQTCCNTAKVLAVLVAMALGMHPRPGRADPLDETARRTFLLTPIGVWDQTPGGTNSVHTYRSRLLANTGGAMPRNVKAGISSGVDFLQSTFDGYYDYLYAPGRLLVFPTHNYGEIEYHAELISSNDLCYGAHINGMPWGDDPNQGLDMLHNYLEKFGGGALLQKDRNGNIRYAGFAQNPANDEQAVYATTASLEMQLTLSRNCTMVQEYVARNCRIALRLLGWQREQHPDLIQYASMSSEVGQNLHANVEFCDYSDWSKQEFRDWLSGLGLYAGQPQYASLSAFNNAFSGATGFPWPSWAAVQPPTNAVWNTTANGRWWQKWQEFRIAQVRNIVQQQANWCREAGWSPDLLFGHQIPIPPNSTSELDRRQASPWTTTFITGAGNGVTAYGPDTANTNLFNALRADDKHWGLFEYNPTDTNSVANNLTALNTVWNSGGRIIAPYTWWGFPEWQIYGTAFETALAQFIANRRNDAFTNLAPYEVGPVMRDVIWSMSYPDHVEAATGAGPLVFTNGIAYGTNATSSPRLSLALDDSPARLLVTDGFFAASFRLHHTAAFPGFGRLLWVNEFDVTNSVSFPVRPGWQVYRINLAEHAAWREQRLKAIWLQPAGNAGGTFALDWFRLEANHCWHFDDPLEYFGANQLTNPVVAGGTLSADCGPDAFFYLATDKRTVGVDADRAGIDAGLFKQVRVRMHSSAAGVAQLFWWRRGTSFAVTNFPVQAGWQTYELDLSNHPDWQGEITQFRLDPATTAGTRVQVDYVTVSPKLLPPRVANADLIVNSSTPVFLWDKAIEPNHPGLTSTLQLATDFFFTNIVYAAGGLTGGRHDYNGPAALDGLHWWRVRTVDAMGTASPWSVPMPMFVRPWTFDRLGDAGWTNQFGPASISGGIWQATTTAGGDPFIYFNTGGYNSRGTWSGHRLTRGINASLYNRVRMRVRVGNTANNFAQFFFLPTGGNFTSINLTLPGDNQWKDLLLDLAGQPAWRGYIQDVRLDPTLAAGVTVALDLVELLPAPPAADSNTTWNFNSDGDYEGWSPSGGFATTQVTSGQLKTALATTGAALEIGPLSFSGSSLWLFRITLRNQSTATHAQLFWTTDADPFFAPARSALIPLVSNDTALRIYALDLSSHPAWTGNRITGLRLLPAADAAGGTVDVDSLLFLGPGYTNRAPTFVGGPDVIRNEDAGPQSIPWASGINPGTGESWQTVSFIVAASNTALFSVPPAIDANGILTFTPAPDAFGSTTVSVQARDNGGTGNGGQDTSAPQSFTITLNPVNDPPAFVAGPDVFRNQDAGPQSLVWATAISPGPANESGQQVSFLVTNDNPALFAVAPAITPDGTLTFLTATNAFGTAAVSVQARDDGGTANGGADTSPSASFTIHINGLPVTGADTLHTHWNVPLSLSAATLLTNDYDPNGGLLTVIGVQPLGTNGSSVRLDHGVLTYQPAPDFAGVDAFAYEVSDNQGGLRQGEVCVHVIQPRIVAAQFLADGTFRIQLNGMPNTAYQLQASTNLAQWVPLSTNLTDGAGILTTEDPSAAGVPGRYYRFVWP